MIICNFKKVTVLIKGFIVLTCPAMADDFPWPTFLPAIINGNEQAPPPEPTLTCANHKVASCSNWIENMTGWEEVGRKILPDCTVKFYEFGMLYYIGTWKPLSETQVSVHNRSRDIVGTYVNSKSYKEGGLTFSCGSDYLIVFSVQRVQGENSPVMYDSAAAVPQFLPSVASRIKWRNIAPQFVVPARRNFMSIAVLCKKSCNEAGAAKGKQDASVES